MFSKLVSFFAAALMLAGICSAIDFPPHPPQGTIELTYNETGSSYYMSLNLAPGPNIYPDTYGSAQIGSGSSYTYIDMHINYTDSSWTIWAVPTSYGGHTIEEPLTAVWIFNTLPVPQACGYAPIENVNNLTYPEDYEWFSDCERGGFPVFHDAAFGFAVSLNEPVKIYNF